VAHFRNNKKQTRPFIDRIYIVKGALLPARQRTKIPDLPETADHQFPWHIFLTICAPDTLKMLAQFYCAVAPQGAGQFQTSIPRWRIYDGEEPQGHHPKAKVHPGIFVDSAGRRMKA